jgi:PAS domain S-box-containing protein
MTMNPLTLPPDIGRQALDHLPMPALLTGPDTRLCYANLAARALAAPDENAAPPMTVAAFLGVDPALVEEWLPPTWWTSAAPGGDEWIAPRRCEIGGRILAGVRRQPVTTADGTRQALLLLEWATVWEQRYLDTLKTQDGLAYALEAAEERYNVLFRESSDPVLILNLAGEILSANAGFEQYTGWGAALWFRGEKAWPDCVHADDLILLERSIHLCAEHAVTELVELRLLSSNNYYQWFEMSLSPLHDETRKVRGIVAVARNINRRKERETQLREKAESMQHRHQRAQLLIAKLKHFFSRVSALPSDIDGYLAGVCETLNDMYRPYAASIHVDFKGERLYVRGQTGLNAETFQIPASLSKAVTKSGLPLYCNTLPLTDPYRNDEQVRQSGFITFLGAPLRDSAGQIRGTLSLLDTDKQYYDNVDVELITVAALHVAARLRAEQQEETNRELADHLRQAQKMEAVGVLAGGIAHDFNNILSGILGFSSYLLSKVEPENPIHRDLQLIEQSAVRAADLTRQLLAFARRKHFAKEAVGLNQVIREVLPLIRRSVARDIEIREELDDSLPPVQGDVGQLNQVLMNLCLNATEALRDRDNACLRLATERRPLTPRERIILSEETDADFVCVTVADNGIGMSPELQEHVYEPFYTTRSDTGGTGLGLAIVYGIVSNHGGHVILDSEEGHGTDFTLYFPVFDAAPSPAETLTPADLTGTETILAIDDESVVRQMVTAILKGNGYKVLTAESGRQGVELLDQLRGRVDLVLLDVVMPDWDGETTFKALRAIEPDLPVLLTSGFANEKKRERLLASGALGLVHKPYKSDDLLRQIRSALDRVQAAR